MSSTKATLNVSEKKHDINLIFLLLLICRQGFDVRIKHHIQTDKAAADYTSMSDSEASTTHDVIRPGKSHLRVDLSDFLT